MAKPTVLVWSRINEKYEIGRGSVDFTAHIPKKVNGVETDDFIHIPVKRHEIHLRHISGDEVFFKHYFNRGMWKWKDIRGRDEISCTEDHVVSELVRMLRWDKSKARQFLGLENDDEGTVS